VNRVLISILIYFIILLSIVPTFAKERGASPAISLHQAIVDGDIEKVQSILADGVDINIRNKLNGTPLHTATEKQQKDIFKLLLDKNADINPINNDGETPLHLAVKSGQKDIVELLLAKGADVNIVSVRRENALSLAQKRGHTEIAELLVKHGATEPSIEFDEYGRDGGRRGLRREGPSTGSGRGMQRQPGAMQAQQEPEEDILADPNEIKANIKKFEGLDKSIEEVAGKSRIGMRRWQQIKTDNRTTLVRVVKRQLDEEVDFIRKVALEEKAKKTADAADALLAKRMERTAKVLKELVAQSKEQRQGRSGVRSRSRTTTRGTRGGMSSQNGRLTGQTGTNVSQPLTGRGDDQTTEQVDVEEQNEINQWLQADVQDYDGKVNLFTTINEQIQTEFIVLRKLSEEEKGKKTTATIDGLLLARQQRLEELTKYVEEEKKKLQEEQDQSGRTRAGQPDTMRQENQSRTRRRRR